MKSYILSHRFSLSFKYTKITHVDVCMYMHTCISRQYLFPFPLFPSLLLAVLPGKKAGRQDRQKEKINAWRLNESDECWIDHNSKLGQQDCLFKGQDPLIIVLAEIDSQAHTVPFPTCRYLHLNATQPMQCTPRCRNASNLKLGVLNNTTSVSLLQQLLYYCNKDVLDNRANTAHTYPLPCCSWSCPITFPLQNIQGHWL